MWAELAEALPEGPFLYPREEIATAPVRFFVAEVVRETVFEQFDDEVPYSVFVAVEEFREDQDPVYIQANLFTERNSQKRILIGEKGRAIRDLGPRLPRKDPGVSSIVRSTSHLWVKVLPGWRKKPRNLRRLGLPGSRRKSIRVPKPLEACIGLLLALVLAQGLRGQGSQLGSTEGALFLLLPVGGARRRSGASHDGRFEP